MKTLEDFGAKASIPEKQNQSPAVIKESVPEKPSQRTAETKTVTKSGEGFIIKEIEIKDFMRYVGKMAKPLTFPNKFTVITGRTGSGKTSILDAITFVLYKRTSRTDIQNVKISDICKPNGYVRITFLQTQEEYEVERGFTSSSAPYLTLKKNGKNIEGHIRELERTVENIIGLDYDGFRNSTFVRQEEMKGLGSEKGADRLEIFQKLFRLETFRKAEVSVSKKQSGVKDSILTLSTEIEVKGEQLANLPSLEKELKGKSEDVKVENKKLKIMMAEIESLNKKVEMLSEKHDEFSTLNGKLKTTEERLEKTKRSLSKAKSKESKIEPLKKEIAVLEKETKGYDDLIAEGEWLRELQQKHLMIKREIERDKEEKETIFKDKNSEVQKLTKRIQESENRIAKLSTSIGKDEAFSMLRKEGSLTERINRIGKELDWLKDRKELVKELNKERKEAESELEGLSEKTENINVDSFKLSEIEAALERTKKDIEEVNENFKKKLEKIDDKIKQGKSNLEKVGFVDAERKNLSKIREKISEMRTKRPDLEMKRKMVKEFGDMGLLIKDLDSQKVTLETELKVMKKKVTTLKKKEEGYQEVKQSLKEKQDKKEELLKEISHAQGEIKRLLGQIEELKMLKKGMKKKEKELFELREKSEILSILKEKVFHNRGIVMYAIDQLLPQLSLATSTNLSDMTDGRFSKARLSSFGGGNRYGVRIEVSGPDGLWHDVQEFSGGEKTQINAALRFAIAKELASMPQVGRTYGRMKTLFIDEGDLGSLDTESSRQLFVKKLFDMGEFFDKIILITHLTEVAEQFPGRIMVYMTPEQVSKIEVMT